MSVNHPLNRAVAFCLIVALSALVASSCSSPTPQEGEVEEEVCEHRGWEGPNDEWNQYPVSYSYTEHEDTLLEPPVVQMMVVDGEGEVSFVEGYRFQTEWTHKHGSWEEIPPTLQWPDSEVGKRPCHFRILADIPPRGVSLGAAPGIDPDSGEFVDGFSYECGRGGDRPCAHLDDDGFVEVYPIPEAILDSPYLIIQGHWNVHPKDMIEDPIRAQMMAAYLFNFSEE